MNNNTTINDLEELKSELLQRVEHIEQTILTLKSLQFATNGSATRSARFIAPQQKEQSKYSDYDVNANLRQKVAFVFRKENRFLKVREIAEILHSLEPNVSVEEFVSSKLSAPITYLKEQGTIVKIKVGSSNINTFWGSPQWLDENEEPKEEHKYDEKQLSYSSQEEIKI